MTRIARQRLLSFETPRLIRFTPQFWGYSFGLMKLLPARFMLDRAEDRGELQPGGHIVETTSSGSAWLSVVRWCANLSMMTQSFWLGSSCGSAASTRCLNSGLNTMISSRVGPIDQILPLAPFIPPPPTPVPGMPTEPENVFSGGLHFVMWPLQISMILACTSAMTARIVARWQAAIAPAP